MMPDAAFLAPLPWLAALALAGWTVATLRRNVGLVDIVWSLFLLTAALVAAFGTPSLSARAALVLTLAAAWALRLAVHLARRNWNAPEDKRYRAIRERNEPGFTWKSLYLVFGLQALLALVVSAPLYAAIVAPGGDGLTVVDVAGALLVLGGLLTEAVADHQLARFRARAPADGQVMDRGLWRWSRHPNYFGEFCVWWGFFAIAAGTGAWWSIVSPLLMSVLLLRVSGVTLLEKDLRNRPGYAQYIARTNAFFPGPRRHA